MTPERRERIKSVFLRARAAAPGERSVFLDGACGADAALRDEVESLLEVDGDAARTRDLRSAAEVVAADWAGGGGHPERIGSYRITGVLGSGGMGVVYRAEQERPRRTVALKVLRGGALPATAVRRFEHEAQVLGRLQHPGVAQIYEAGAADTGAGPQLFFAMELVEGRSLTEHAREKALDLRERIALFVRVCEAVEHAHQKGVIHRDLKPANILVDASGQPKVLDFGVARLTGSDVRVTTLHTDAGQLIGTLAYMSPEQAAGDPDELDTRSDVYSLGVVLYEVLSGRLPYAVERRMIPEAVRVIREQDPASLSAVSRVFRGDLETICARALEKDRSRRYQSAAALAADLARHLRDEPIEARAPTTMYQVLKFARRHKALVGGVGAVFLALVAGVAATTTQAIVAGRERDRAENAEGLATRRLAEVEAILDFVNKRMLGSVDPGQARGRVVTVREVLDNAARTVETEFKEQPLIEASVRMTLGNLYRRLGEYGAARPHVEAGVALRRRVLGDRHGETLVARAEMGALLHAEGRFADEEALLVPLLATMREALGVDHPQTLATESSLASCHCQQGHFDEGERLMADALERQRRVLGVDHADVDTTLTNLGTIHRERGRPDLAEPLWREALELRRRRLGDGDDHPDTLVVLNNLAIAAGELGRLEEAAALHRRVLDTSERVWGSEHPTTAMVRANLGGIYLRLSRYADAEPLLRRALETRKRADEGDHPDSAKITEMLAGVCTQTGRYTEAEDILKDIIERYRRSLGEENERTLNATLGLAVTYRNMGRFEEAESRYQALLDIYGRLEGDEHPMVPGLWAEVGLVRRAQDRLQEAEELLARALVRLRPQYKPGNFMPGYMAALAEVIWRQGRGSEAEPLFNEAVETARRDLAPGHRHFGFILPPYSRFLAATGRFGDAERYLVEAHAILAGLRGEDHASTRRIAADLADMYGAWATAEPETGKAELGAQWRLKSADQGQGPEGAITGNR